MFGKKKHNALETGQAIKENPRGDPASVYAEALKMEGILSQAREEGSLPIHMPFPPANPFLYRLDNFSLPGKINWRWSETGWRRPARTGIWGRSSP
jgi:hypothetical protein